MVAVDTIFGDQRMGKTKKFFKNQKCNVCAITKFFQLAALICKPHQDFLCYRMTPL